MRSWRDPIPDGQMCETCGKRPGTVIWAEGGFMAVNHGASFEYRCTRCCDEAQVEWLRGRAAELGMLVVDPWELVTETKSDDDSLHFWARDALRQWKESDNAPDTETLGWQVWEWYLSPQAEERGYSTEDAESFMAWWNEL